MGLIHWDRLIHIYASVNYAIIDADASLSPFRRQANNCTNVGIVLIDP